MGDDDTKAQRHREVERKFVMAANGTLPDLGALDGVASVGESGEVALDATYFDTPTRTLTAHDVSLRRREGGDDAGWHLKRPSVGGSGDDRQELRLPLTDGSGEDDVPDELARAVRGLTRGRRLDAVVAMHTARIERRLQAEDGATVAVVADDLVTVRRPHDDGEPISWHEIEVELVDGGSSFLDTVTEVFERAGIHRASWPSKVRHALELLRDDQVLALATPAGRLDAKATVGATVRERLRTNVDVIVRMDAPMRDADEDAVHDVRVAARRLRSALATFRPFLDRDITDPLRDELKWFGHVLGAVRDADVLGTRLIGSAQALPDELSLGPVVDRISTELRRTHDRSFAELTRVLDEPRTYALLDALDALATDPPLRDDAGARARKVLPPRLGKEIRRVRQASRAVDEARDEDARLTALHDLRKAAKRARYAAETAEPVLGRPAAKLARRMEDLQDALGEHQDTVAARAELRRIGALVSGYPSENGFTFGVLHEREAVASEKALQPVAELRRKATRSPFSGSA